MLLTKLYNRHADIFLSQKYPADFEGVVVAVW